MLLYFPHGTKLTLSAFLKICMRSVGDYSEVWRGFLERGVTHYCGVHQFVTGSDPKLTFSCFLGTNSVRSSLPS